MIHDENVKRMEQQRLDEEDFDDEEESLDIEEVCEDCEELIEDCTCSDPVTDTEEDDYSPFTPKDPVK